jgi:nucleoid-associated protein YgaU
MKKTYSNLSSCVLFIALAMSLSACSSSQTSDSEFGDDIPADAGTDAVPSDHAENATPADGAQQDQAQPQDQAQASNSDQQQQAQPADQQQQPPQAQDQVASADPQAQPSVTPDANSLTSTTPPPAEPAPTVAETKSEPVTPAPIAETASTTPSTPSTPSETPSSSTGGSESYNVRHGDTLMRIAFEKYGDLYKWKQIYEANRDKIKDPNVILPGTVLTLESASNDLPAHTGKRYMIKHGDTLARISNDVYGTPSKWKKIWEHNKPWIPNPNRIFAGFYLYYTGGKSPEDIEQHEEQNPVAPMAQDSGTEQQAPREPASATPPAAK